MKTKIFFLITIILVILTLNIAMAATHYDQDVSYIDRTGKLTYYGTVTFADSGSGAIYYTQAMFIGAVSEDYGYAYFVCSEVGTEDVNVFVEYAPTEDGPWVAGTTDTDLDAVGTTAKTDTIGIVQGADAVVYHCFNFMRFKFVAGQAMNSTVLTYYAGFRKPSGLERMNVGLTKDTQ